MKQIILIIVIFIYTINISGQTEKEKALIFKETNIKELLILKNKIIKKNDIKKNKIKIFLKKNKNYSETYFKHGNKYSLVDIQNGKPIYITTSNVGAAQSTKTNHLQVGGSLNLDLEGENITVGVWDGGHVRETHQEFQLNGSSKVMIFNNTGYSDHSTHVAGTISAIGVNPNAKGMATKALIHSYDWFNDTTEIITEITNNALLLSNHSYGVPVSSSPAWRKGCYDDEAREWDMIAYNAEYYLPIMSAGNDGATTYTGGLADGYDKLVGNKNSKNCLVIANANPFINSTTGSLINLTINTSSSQGPSDDGRIKPDLTADGTDTFSCVAFNPSNSMTSNNSYDTYTGTSMAAPNTTGTLVLLQEYYNQLNNKYLKSASLRALVIHTAERGLLLANGPDAKLGYGLLNAKKAAELILEDKNSNNAFIKERTLNNSEVYTYQFSTNGNSKITATLAWTDPAGNSQNGQSNSSVPALVNDLDIRIVNNTNTYFPWKLQLSDITANAIKGDNLVDNVEKIEIEAPIAGNYTLTISNKGVLTNGSQNYSLILSGNDIVLSTTNKTITTFKAYPNPVKNNLTIEGIDTITNVSIFNLLGQKVIDANPNNTNTIINTESLNKGTYFAKVTINGATETMKIIK